MDTLQFHTLPKYISENGTQFNQLSTSFQVYGKPIHSAPIVLVNHAFTGNSNITNSKEGWWKEIVGIDKLIDLNTFTVIAFNIPGNGYDNVFIKNYKDLIAKDIATIFYKVLQELHITNIYAIIGGSLGGGIAWEMACLFPSFAKYIIPIASDWKATDWIIAHNSIQESILLNSVNPLEDARKMAMLFYRTPLSFKHKFQRTKSIDNETFNIESWLNHHGNKLKFRFELQAYLLMNHLLRSLDVAQENLCKIEATIIQISVKSDLFFSPEENIATKSILDNLGIENQYHEIQSIDGHDAFLIEHEQITAFLGPIFKKNIK